MQNFAAIGPFGAEIWRGGQIDPPPPPSKNLLSKSPVKIGLSSTPKFPISNFELLPWTPSLVWMSVEPTLFAFGRTASGNGCMDQRGTTSSDNQFLLTQKTENNYIAEAPSNPLDHYWTSPFITISTFDNINCTLGYHIKICLFVQLFILFLFSGLNPNQL